MSEGALPLVGREAELGVFERALEAVGSGRSWAVGALGEPGIGKSRLLGALSHRAAERGHLVLAGRAAELERDVPFALWVEALDGQVAHAGGEALSRLGEEQLADLAVALPVVARVAEVTPTATVERHRVARAVRGPGVRWAWRTRCTRPRVGGTPRCWGSGRCRARAAAALMPPSLGRAARARLNGESGGNPFYLQALAGAGAAAPGARPVPDRRCPARGGRGGRRRFAQVWISSTMKW